MTDRHPLATRIEELLASVNSAWDEVAEAKDLSAKDQHRIDAYLDCARLSVVMALTFLTHPLPLETKPATRPESLKP